MSILNNYNDKQWKLLKQLMPTENEKARLKARIIESIQSQSTHQGIKRKYQWKALLATCLFVLLCSGFIYKLIQDAEESHTAVSSLNEIEDISWNVKDIFPKKTADGWEIYRANEKIPVGQIELMSEEEQANLAVGLSMFVKEELVDFPYSMTLNIEHVKMMDTAIRYHFFVPYGDEKIVHFTFDYPKLEHAEIFHVMSTVKIAGFAPASHPAEAYVKHGYGKMIFPVGLEPLSISYEKEIYEWENANPTSFKAYLEKIASDNGLYAWKKEAEGEQAATFKSRNEKEIVTITLDGKRLIYEFTNLYEDE